MKLTLKRYLLALAGAASLAVAAPAAAVFINFDNVTPGSTANASLAAAGIDWISFASGQYVPSYDGFGDPIPGSQHWAVDPTVGPIVTGNPADSNWGPAPSGINALDARLDQVLLSFTSAQNLSAFSVTLDNSTLGDLPPSNLLFLNAAGLTIAQLAFNQTVPGAVVSYSGLVSGVDSILLPAGAFYDNISVTPVPEPTSFAFMLAGLALMGVSAGKRRIFG